MAMLKFLAVVAALALFAPLAVQAQPDPAVTIKPLPPLPLPPLPAFGFPWQGGWSFGGNPNRDNGGHDGRGSGGDHRHYQNAPAPLLAAGLPAFALLGGAGALARLKRRARRAATKTV